MTTVASRNEIDVAEMRHTTPLDLIHNSQLKASPDNASCVFSNGRIYCRARELGLLDQAYQRLKDRLSLHGATKKSRTELVVIGGNQGTGKTVLAQALRPAVLRDGGYFITARFEQLWRPQPRSVIVTALNQLAAQILDRGKERVQYLKSQLLKTIDGEEFGVLIDMIPALEEVFGQQGRQEHADLVDHVEVARKGNSVLRKFFRAASSTGYPLVLFLDDVDAADEKSLDLFRSFLFDYGMKGVLYIAAYSDGPKGALNSWLGTKSIFDPHNSQVTTTEMYLSIATEGDLAVMVDQMLGLGFDRALQLATYLYRCTNGNTYFAIEMLRAMWTTNALQYEHGRDRNNWSWDGALGDSYASVEQLIQFKITTLPQETTQILLTASCLGSSLDIVLLSRLHKQSVLPHLVAAHEKGLLQTDSDQGEWRFAHKTVSNVVYGLIPTDSRSLRHYRIGRRLWKRLDKDDVAANIFLIVGQLMLGKDQVSDGKERVAVARLCLRAGVHAVHLSNFETAFSFFEHGIALLGKEGWQDDYHTCLDLHTDAAEVAYCTGRFDRVYMLFEEVLSLADRFEDTFRIRLSNVLALGRTGKCKEAVDQGLGILAKLGEVLPTTVRRADIQREHKRTKQKLSGKSNDALLRLAPLKNLEKLAAMQIFNVIYPYAYAANPDLCPLIGARMVYISLAYGLCPESCVGFALYSMLVCGFANDIDQGLRLGAVGIALLERFESKYWLGRVSVFYGFIYGFKNPFQEALKPLELAHRVALGSGDIEFAMLNANMYMWIQFEFAPLIDLENTVRGQAEQMQVYGQENNLEELRPMWQFIHNITGRAVGDPCLLAAEIVGETEIGLFRAHGDVGFFTMAINFILNDFDGAEKAAQMCLPILDSSFTTTKQVVVWFFYSLTCLAQARKRNQRRLVPSMKKQIQRFRICAEQCPINFLGKQYLLEAELASFKSDHKTATSKYTGAIALSREAGLTMQTALANERYARYLLERGELVSAKAFLRESLTMYKEWGASTKVHRLKQELNILDT